MKTDVIHNTNCMEGLKELPDRSIHCCVTSPPYWGLRDYGTSDQLGLEETPQEYVDNMVKLFRQVRRVLKDDGTLWLNLGDSYSGSGKGPSKSINQEHHHLEHTHSKIVPQGIKPKDLIGIPWMVAFALQADGWYLRQDIIWHKPNPMPESVTDRCTKSHEYIFLLTKSARYYYDVDAIKEPMAESSIGRLNQDIESQTGTTRAVGKTNGNLKAVGDIDGGRNKRSVWTVTTKPYKEAHFAVYPEKLIEPCIKAGCPKGGTVLDPFMGAGTTGLVAKKLSRHYVGYELNPEYIKIAEKRIFNEIGLFL